MITLDLAVVGSALAVLAFAAKVIRGAEANARQTTAMQASVDINLTKIQGQLELIIYRLDQLEEHNERLSLL